MLDDILVRPSPVNGLQNPSDLSRHQPSGSNTGQKSYAAIRHVKSASIGYAVRVWRGRFGSGLTYSTAVRPMKTFVSPARSITTPGSSCEAISNGRAKKERKESKIIVEVKRQEVEGANCFAYAARLYVHTPVICDRSHGVVDA